MIIIRKCKPSDKAHIIKLWNEIFPPEKHHNNPEIAFDLKMKHQDNLFFIAIDNNIIIGTVLAGFDGHRGWIYSLGVTSSCRRHGAGTQLMKKALNALKKRGCLKVNLQITGETSELVDFYQTNGFTVEKRISMGKTLY